MTVSPMKTATTKAMNAVAEKFGVKVAILECSGYIRLLAHKKGEELFRVETTAMSLPEARRAVIRGLEDWFGGSPAV